MAVTCYTVRPGEGSGWVTFFEIGTESNARGVFLILGPTSTGAGGAAATARRATQDVARRIVSAFKSARDMEPADLIGEVRREVSESRLPLEFGVVVALPHQIAFLVDGRARLLPLTATARRRWERDAPQPGVITLCPVEGGDRYYLGRVPPEAAQGLASADMVERLERGGTADGALIINFLALREGAAVDSSAGSQAPQSAAPRESPPDSSPASPETENGFAAPPGDLHVEEADPEAEKAPAPVVLPDWLEDGPSGSGPRVTRDDSGLLAPREPAPSGRRDEAAAPPATLIEPSGVDADVPRTRTRMARRRKAAAGTAWTFFAVAAVSLAVYVLVLRPRVRGVPDPAPPAPQVTETPAQKSETPPAEDAPASATARGESGILWETRLPAAVTGSPLRAMGRVIAGCRDGRIYGLDAFTGEIAWSRITSKGFGGTAAIADSVGFIGGFDGVVRAFDVRTGIAVWDYETAGRIMASPRLAGDGRIIAASYDQTLHALDVKTGALAWKRRLGAQLWATPALDEKYVYAPGLDGMVASVNKKWGSVAWRFRASDEIYSAPAVARGIVVFGCEDGNVYAVDALSGSLRWKRNVGRAVGGGVVAVEGLFVVGDDAGVLHALNEADGEEAWSYRAGAAIKSTPVVEDGAILFSSHDGDIHAVATDGTAIGRFPIDAPMASSPSLFGDSLYVGAHDGRVIALKLR